MMHIPVMLDDVLGVLGDISGARVLDATFGAGGYTRAFLERGAIVTSFDRDPTVQETADAVRREYGDRFTFVAAPFAEMANLDEIFDAIVFDLGISSMQIDVAERGFSFRADAPLDMRMSGAGMSAADLIAGLAARGGAGELAKILRDYGDVKNAGGLARKILDARPTTTFGLRNLISNPRDVAPVFQALRIAVNDEMGEITRALGAVPDMLNVGGKCVCVTFHSIEDRIVKSTFRDLTAPVGDPHLPVVATPRFVAMRPRTPSAQEVASNPRARSAHLRGIIKSY